MSNRFSRREWLERAVLFTGAAVAGVVGDRAWSARRRAPAPHTVTPTAPPIALSLSELQRRARADRAADRALSPDVAALGHVNRIHGLIATSDDVILLGNADPRAPTFHLDDLMVAMRSAYQVDPLYRDSPGCTIDPRDRSKDPWTVQDVRVLGMPPCAMAKRHVTLDYELKLARAGVRRIEGMPQAFGEDAAGGSLCDSNASPSSERQARFWFAPHYPNARPRFEADDAAILIKHPIGVQLLTEQRLHAGKNDGASSGDEADAFAGAVTRLLAAGTRRDYLELINDFRLIELGQLCRVREIPPATFAYLLREHVVQPVEIPSMVVGISRSDTTTVVCSGKVEITNGTATGHIESRRLERRYRGGVDAGVEVPAAAVEKQPGRFAGLSRRVTDARPAPTALTWRVPD
jgi:hypothetical protein